MCRQFRGGGQVYDGEVRLADVTFDIQDDSGTIIPIDSRDIASLREALIVNQKTLALQSPEGIFSIHIGGGMKLSSSGGDTLASFSVLVE